MNVILSSSLCLAALLFPLAVSQSGSSAKKMKMPDFRKMEPFKGRVTKVERIPHHPHYRLHSASGPDFRVTVTKADGTRIVIQRIHTQLTQGPARLKSLLNKKECALPKEIAEIEDR